ncbi:hypothetical protein P43SY_003598 [Pythium insidiosum]|uniref:DDE Tnp4 domain-containing protein n=1 Tax=Pythium insidiosum TaxID=114742 RepID=A0AAD5LFB1_PYTIN|nr:hypothetical protein P43SY_003598 [Pythium insidiosum]
MSQAPDHIAQVLDLFIARQAERDSELGRFQGLESDYDEEYDTPAPVYDSYLERGVTSVQAMINFAPSEFNTLWDTVSKYVATRWNVGRGRRSATSAKDVFFMLLTVLKQAGTLEMHAESFKLKAPAFERMILSFLAVAGPKLYFDQVEQKARALTMTELVKNGRRFDCFPSALYATDVTFQQSNRPTGNMAEGKVYFSGKHKLYGLKVEVSVCPSGLAIDATEHEPGSTADIQLFNKNIEFHKAQRVKTTAEYGIDDDGPLLVEFPDEWCVLVDKGYQGLGDHVRAIHPKKKPKIAFLAYEDQVINRKISHDRIIVENFFGRLCGLWRVCSDNYRWNEDNYDMIFKTAIGLTNFHIRRNPLREADRERYHQIEARRREIGREAQRKRRLSQEKYRQRKRAHQES